MTDAVAASMAEVAEMRRRQAETDRKQESLERQMAELMARMNPQAISFKESPFAVPATITRPSTSALRTAGPQQVLLGLPWAQLPCAQGNAVEGYSSALC